MSVLSYGVQSHHLLTAQHSVITSQLRCSEPSFSVGHSEPPSLISLAFRATISLQLDVQSHHRFLVMTFKDVFLSLTFRDVNSQFWRSESSSSSIRHSKPPSILSYDVQRRLSQFRRSEPPSLFNLAFKATIISQLQHSEPHFQLWHSQPHFQFSIQNCCLFLVTTFKAAISSQLRRLESSFTIWRSEPLSLLSFGTQSHHLFSVWAFKASIFFQFGIQSHYLFLVMTFKVIMHTHSGIQSHHFPHFSVQSHFSSTLSFRVIALDIHIHWHCTSCLHDFTFVLIFPTLLPCAYRLFIMSFQISPSIVHDIVL